ncbi:MAG: NAD(P)-dependent oxidoreductase [Paludibacteraceae bacterium]|nr:NAD(P)-dependent oxidoreductase [Paludibacteraceae bacterium]
MKILITGANGFIGSFVVEEAINRGFDTWAAMRSNSSKSNLAGLNPNFIDLPYGNIDELKKILLKQKDSFGKWDYVVHTMGLTKCKQKTDFDVVNFQYTQNLIKALIETEMVPDHFVYMSSLSAFGDGDKITLKEIRLDDEPKPNTYYGMSKLKSERFIQSLDSDQFHYTILRPTGVYGPKEKDYFVMLQTLSNHLNPGIGYTPQYITFIYVKDLVKTIFLSIEKKAYGKAYFVADGDVWTSDEYAELCKKLLGVKALTLKIPECVAKLVCYTFDKIGGLFGVTPTLNIDKYNILVAKNWKCDIQPLKEELGFVADYPLEKGMIECIDWYKANKWL